MSLTSYLDKSYFVASRGGYVANIQAMLRDKLKHQVRQHFLSSTATSSSIQMFDNHCDFIFMLKM